MKKTLFAALAAFTMATAHAEQQLGVEVYPGAKPVPEVAQFMKDSLKLTGHAYATGDSMEKVVAFYKKQPGLTHTPDPDSKPASFMGKNVRVTVQNPWADMKTGKVMNNTLVSIVKLN